MDPEEDPTRAGRTSPASVSAEPEPLHPSPGDRIGRFVVRELIAEGGMGMVFAADDPELGRVVAIKLLHPALGGPAEEQKARLLREAQAMARVSHANLVTVFDVGTHHGQVFVAMEYVSGVTLKEWLGPRRDWKRIVEVFLGAGRGLAAAHAAGLVHRDFKPANVLVGDDGIPQVLDFGLVRRAGEVDPAAPEAEDSAPREDTLAIDLTRTGSVMGTPAYMAPEQHLGEPTDARSDQFSFCVALYEALYDERPFPGDAAGHVTVAVLENQRRPAPRRSPVPESVYKILDRGLARDPGLRWPAMDALLDVLAQEVARAATPPRRQRSWWPAAAALVLLAGGGVAAWYVLGAGAPAPLESPEVPELSPAAGGAGGSGGRQRGMPRPRERPTPALGTPSAVPIGPTAAGDRPPAGAAKGGPTGTGGSLEDRGTQLPGVEEEPLPSPEPEEPPDEPPPAPEPVEEPPAEGE